MRRPIWNAIERKLDDYSLRKKFYIFYVLCVMLPLIVTDAVVLSIVENAEKESSRHEMSSIASAVGYNLNSMVNNAEEAAKSIYTSKRIDDFISKEYTSSAEYVSEYQSFFQDTLFENTLGMSNIIFFLYADNPTIVNGGKVNDMSAVRNTDSYRLLEQKEILLLMNVGNVLNAGFEIQYLLGNGLIQDVSQTIDIYVLKWGISQGDYAIGTAAGIFKSVVSIILIFIANRIAKHNGEEQLF